MGTLFTICTNMYGTASLGSDRYERMVNWDTLRSILSPIRSKKGTHRSSSTECGSSTWTSTASRLLLPLIPRFHAYAMSWLSVEVMEFHKSRVYWSKKAGSARPTQRRTHVQCPISTLTGFFSTNARACAAQRSLHSGSPPRAIRSITCSSAASCVDLAAASTNSL